MRDVKNIESKATFREISPLSCEVQFYQLEINPKPFLTVQEYVDEPEPSTDVSPAACSFCAIEADR
jgi:hypothetical protein